MSGVDAQCPATDWRGTPLATKPTPNDEFHPELANYYTSTVLQATWPAFIGLGAFVALLLSFIIWRLVISIAGCINSKKVKKPPPGNEISTEDPNARVASQALTSKTTFWVRIALVVLFFGGLSGIIYGMVRINSELVDQGLDTVMNVENYLGRVLDVLDGSVTAANSIDSALVDIQELIDVNVNATDVSSQLDCLSPWLTSLPDPVPIRSDLEQAVDIISQLGPALQTVSENLAVLVYRDEAGNWAGTLPSLIAAEPQLQELASQAAAFSAAAAAVPILTPNYGAMQSARNTLDTLMNSPPYASKLAALDATGDALTNTQTAVIGADDAMISSLTLANDLFSGPAITLNATLAVVTDSYIAARPCMVSLRSRTELINATVLQLPGSLQSSLDILYTTQGKLDGVLDVEGGADGMTTSQSLSLALADAEEQLTEAQDVAARLSGARQQLDGNSQFQLSTLVSSLQTVRDIMANAQGSLTVLLGQMNAYLAGSPVVPYFALASQTQTAGTSANALANSLQQFLTSAAPAFDESQAVFDELTAVDITAGLSELGDKMQSLPAGEALLAPMDDYAAQYASLPQPFTLLIDEAKTQVVDIVNDVSGTVVDSRSVLGDAISGAERVSLDIRDNTVDKISEYRVEYEPEVRHYETIRQAALYSMFAVTLLLSLILLAGTVMLWPAALKLATFLLLVMFTVEFALVVAITAGLKVGNDGCSNLEAQVLQRIDSPEATTILRFYLYGEGTTAKDILNDQLDVNIDTALEQVASAREELQAGIDSYNVRGAMAVAVNQAVAGSYSVVTGIETTLALIEYVPVHNLYVESKQYVCCTCLDMGGGIWTGIIIAGCCTFVQCILAMVLIGMFDKLKLDGCCMWYGTKAGKAVLQAKDTRFPDTAALEAGISGLPDTWDAQPTKPPRQSRIFSLFGRRSDTTTAGRKSSISITANGSVSQIIPGGQEGLRRRSSGQTPSAPLPPP